MPTNLAAGSRDFFIYHIPGMVFLSGLLLQLIPFEFFRKSVTNMTLLFGIGSTVGFIISGYLVGIFLTELRKTRWLRKFGFDYDSILCAKNYNWWKINGNKIYRDILKKVYKKEGFFNIPVFKSRQKVNTRITNDEEMQGWREVLLFARMYLYFVTKDFIGLKVQRSFDVPRGRALIALSFLTLYILSPIVLCIILILFPGEKSVVTIVWYLLICLTFLFGFHLFNRSYISTQRKHILTICKYLLIHKKHNN